VNEENEKKGLCPKPPTEYLLGLAMGAVVISALFIAVYLIPVSINGEFRYYGTHIDSWMYRGTINIPQNTQIPGDAWILGLNLKMEHYDETSAGKIADTLGMNNYRISDDGTYYTVENENATLILAKDGFYLSYILRNVPYKENNLSDSHLLLLAKKAIVKYSNLLPEGVTIIPMDVKDGRFINIHGKHVVYTKLVRLKALFGSHVVTIPLSMEFDWKGRMVGLKSALYKIDPGEYMVFPSFIRALRWMEKNGIPIPKDCFNFSKVVLTNVTVVYSPIKDSNSISPGYHMTFDIVDSGGKRICRDEITVVWTQK